MAKLSRTGCERALWRNVNGYGLIPVLAPSPQRIADATFTSCFRDSLDERTLGVRRSTTDCYNSYENLQNG